MSNTNDGIGGFLDLEIRRPGCKPYHDGALLSTARSCFLHILETLRPRHVFMPFYICDVMGDPLRSSGTSYSCYALDADLQPEALPEQLRAGEMFLYVNYFGVKGNYAVTLAERYGERLILDNSQAFFFRPPKRVCAFNSARKFFGVPDGAYLHFRDYVIPESMDRSGADARHLFLRADGERELGFKAYKENEQTLGCQLRQSSILSARLLEQVDYKLSAARRRENYNALEESLAEYNAMNLTLSEDDVPMCYPFLPNAPLRERLISRNIFVPKYWPAVLGSETEGFDWERRLTSHLCALPIDQRYSTDHMRQIADITQWLLDNE